jgi:hypothetical protein
MVTALKQQINVASNDDIADHYATHPAQGARDGKFTPQVSANCDKITEVDLEECSQMLD